MDKHQTENPAGKAIHHFKVVGLLGGSIAMGADLRISREEGAGNP